MHDNLVVPTRSAYGYPLLVKQLLTQAISIHGDQQISYRGELRLTYRDWRRRLGRLACALAATGVRHGSTVAIMDWDSHRYLECYFGVPMMGATLFTVNVRLSPQQILYTLNDAGADVVLVHADFVPLLARIRMGLVRQPTFVLLADGHDVPPGALDGAPFAGEYEAMLAAAPADYDFPDFDERTRAAMFYTTGTTGDPKGVCYSHRDIVLHTLTAATSLCSPCEGQRMHREDVYMPITPMFHVLAWGMPYVAIMLGLRTVLPGRYAPAALLALRASEGVTFSHCVPTVLQMLLQEAAARKQDLHGWKMVIGGSALSPVLCEDALARGIDIFAGYGMSETGPIVALAQLPPGHAPATREEEIHMRCATGRPVPLVDLRIVDAAAGDDGMRDVPRDGRSQGEIVLRAPYLTRGYHHQPEASEVLWAGGYLHTQDVAVMGPDGLVRIVDRLKDVIKTGGEWVSSIDIENLVTHIAGVQECAVVGVPDARWGERPMAYVVRKPGAEIGAHEIRARLLAHVAEHRLSKFAVPEAGRIAFVAEIPRTSVGKIDKKRLRERMAG